MIGIIDRCRYIAKISIQIKSYNDITIDNIYSIKIIMVGEEGTLRAKIYKYLTLTWLFLRTTSRTPPHQKFHPHIHKFSFLDPFPRKVRSQHYQQEDIYIEK